MATAYIYISLSVILTAAGQITFKTYSTSNKKALLLLSLVLFLSVPILNFLSLKSLSIDAVYIANSLTILLVVALSKLYLNEPINRKALVGCLAIAAGVILYAM